MSVCSWTRPGGASRQQTRSNQSNPFLGSVSTAKPVKRQVYDTVAQAAKTIILTRSYMHGTDTAGPLAGLKAGPSAQCGYSSVITSNVVMVAEVAQHLTEVRWSKHLLFPQPGQKFYTLGGNWQRAASKIRFLQLWAAQMLMDIRIRLSWGSN